MARLIRGAGYRLLTRRVDDPHDLDLFANGLVVRGRGGYHQADVLGELVWAPAFGNPIRLFLEAKWRGIPAQRTNSKRVGLQETRHAVGIVQDVNQMLATVARRPDGAPPMRPGRYDYIQGDRIFSYTYRYALFSTVGFTKPAQAYALAHQISLIDLSHFDYEALLSSIDRAAGYIVRDASSTDLSQEKFIDVLRRSLRKDLWYEYYDSSETLAEELLRHRLQDVIRSVLRIQDLFFGVTSTGLVLLLKADDPEEMLRIMSSDSDPSVDLTWPTDDPLNWTASLKNPQDHRARPPCVLRFSLPEYLLDALSVKAQRERLEFALSMKEVHFSRITVIHITERKTLMCSLKIDVDRLRQAQRELKASK